MTDHADTVRDDPNNPDEMDDVELLTRLLNGQLDPERADAVRRRLKEDAAFRDLAAPLLLAWSVPTHLERKPRPEGEWERDWSAFTRRVGIDRARPAPSRGSPLRRWRRWGRWLAFVVLGLALGGVFAFREPLGLRLGSEILPYDTGWIPLGDGIDVQLAPDAQLRIIRRPLRDMQQVLLVAGTARFRVAAFYPTARAPRRESLVVRTRAGLVTGGESEFTVTVRADTTDVLVHPLVRRAFLQSLEMTVTATTERLDTVYQLLLNDLDRARLVRGRRPLRLTEDP